MGRNFDDYPGLQPMRSWANTYAQHCNITFKTESIMRKKSFSSCHYHTISIFQYFFSFLFQNSEILSRKSSASSTGSLDRNNEKLKNSCSGGRNNTPQKIANSVKARIAMFSSSPPAPSSLSSNSSGNESSLTRSLTHSDVRFEDPSMQVSWIMWFSMWFSLIVSFWNFFDT